MSFNKFIEKVNQTVNSTQENTGNDDVLKSDEPFKMERYLRVNGQEVKSPIGWYLLWQWWTL